MKKNDIFSTSISFIKQNKVKSSIYCVVFALLTLLGNVIINFNYNVNSYLENKVNKDINGRKLLVHKVDLETNQPYTYAKITEELQNYDHIEYFYNTDDNYVTTNWTDVEKETSISLLPLKFNMKLSTVFGRNIEKDNEIICPLYIIPTNSKKTGELIDMQLYLNKEITLKYDKLRAIIDEGEPKLVLENTFTRKFKVVGLYQNVFSSLYTNECYLIEDELAVISDEASHIYEEEFNVTKNSNFTTVIVDKVENVKEVYDTLIEDGFDISLGLDIDYEPINMYKYISYAILILILICMFVTTNIYIQSVIKDKKYEIGMYKTFGYKNKTVTSIFEVFTFIITGVSYILSIIILLIIVYISNNIISNYISLALLTIKLSLVIEVIYMILVFSIVYLNTTIISKRIYKMEVRNILNENNN